MKALVLKGRGQIAYVEKERPVLAAEHGVLLRPLLVSPCTSDVHTIWQGSPKRPDLTLGHEVIARVEENGAEVRDFRVGDIVAVSAVTPDWSRPEVEENYAHAGHNFSAHMLGNTIDGAFQECFYLPYADRNLAHIPAGMSLEDALMCVDVMQTGFTAVEEAGVKPGDTVVVLGIGAIGLAAIMAAKLAGAARIYAVGSRSENVRIAESMDENAGCRADEGLAAEKRATAADRCRVEVLNYRTLHWPLPQGLHPLANSTGSAVVNYVLDQTGTKGADCVLLCGGDAWSFPQAIDMVKYGTGVVSNVMYFGADPEVQDAELAVLTEDAARSALRSSDAAGAGSTASAPLNHCIDGLLLPKFSIGRGMAGKTLRFSLSRGGRTHLEQVLSLVQAHDLHPSVFITKRYRGLEQIAQAIDDMKERKAIKIAVELPYAKEML